MATMAAIASAVGAPNASIYHRFRSRDELLGRLWLQKAAFFQDSFAKALIEPDAVEAGLQAALSLPRSTRADFNGARILLLHRREDFLGGGWPEEMSREAERLGLQVAQILDGLTKRLFRSTSSKARQTTTFAVLDVPFGAVRRYVGANKVPPQHVDELITAAYNAIIRK
jgi:AcrR family transcriptional regulator